MGSIFCPGVSLSVSFSLIVFLAQILLRILDLIHSARHNAIGERSFPDLGGMVVEVAV